MGQPIREAGGASGWREVILFLIREVWEAGGEGKKLKGGERRTPCVPSLLLRI